MKLLPLYNRIRKTLVLGVPMLWYVLFLLLPFLFVLKISLAHVIYGNPPFTPFLTFKHDTLDVIINIENYITLFTHKVYALAFLSSIKLAFITTCFCILIGYPMAYAMSQAKPKWQFFLFLLIILPYWTSFLLRAYAWTTILSNNGTINHLLLANGLIAHPIHMMYTSFSVTIGLIYGYLPYFILPVYATLLKQDFSLTEAALDLGAHPIKAFFSVTVPLSLPGIIAGAMLVFIPATGEVVIPQILGGLNTLMIGNLIWQEFFIAVNWPLACALSIAMLFVLLLPIIVFERIQLKVNKEAAS